ncbi:uncharacterized protein EV420DRAFT_1644783 [Desarmillaria tabescens]|uniref:HNH nuclease domain-containing protein n=1 Tax=Armillaria tabescens TaxID=1929756 RepID=A0AA39K6S9_ARMTA|nr:uncharacterized protein EV420DRAFT_1644783 [Desarmillaria tabescens]KAK0455560.1 hypothetical protein EV420DRAFT_1644783 [Desarmillaria tabescens]
MPSPLPPNPFDPPSHEHAAYESCLTLEVSGPWETSESVAMFRFSPQVMARVLGYALIHHPSSSMAMGREISSCGDNAKLMAGLGYLYVMGVIRMFKKHPKASVHSSQPESPPDSILPSLPQSSPSDAKTLVSKERCSGNMDTASLRNDLTTIYLAAGERKTDMEPGHIFKMQDQDQGYIGGGLIDALSWASSASTVLERLAGSSVPELNQNKAENTFTISPNLHGPFDWLGISLHPIDQDSNTYEIHTYPPSENAEYGVSDRVILTGQIPLPSRRYLVLHDACAKIVYLSGAGEVMERLFWDMGNARVLAEGGGDRGLLALALFRSSNL